MRPKFPALALLFMCVTLCGVSRGRSAFIPDKSDEQSRVAAYTPGNWGIHDAGIFYTPIYDGLISTYGNTGIIDPETGDAIVGTSYPKGSELNYVFTGGIWIGGLVEGDTLVSVAYSGWTPGREIIPENFPEGGVSRTGNYGDDEFLSITVDTVTETDNSYIGNLTPLGLKVRGRSYSWSDPRYDDFVILEYELNNIGTNIIQNCWLGILVDGDVYHRDELYSGYNDDIAGVIDTNVEIDGDERRMLIPYIFDNDGDPDGGSWNYRSPRGAVSVSLLGTSFPVGGINANWWYSNYAQGYDFSPRRLDTSGAPVRLFGNNNLGTPLTDGDMYYVLSTPEVDYDMLEVRVHDSSDGWLPWEATQLGYGDGADVKMMLSVGGFDFQPGAVETLTVALSACDNLHSEPNGWDSLWDIYNPHAFGDYLNYHDLIVHHLKADTVYRSGYTLPYPGPPAGLHITDYTDSTVALAWNESHRPDLAGYYIYVRDTLGDPMWRRMYAAAPGDTACTHHPQHYDRVYQYAASLHLSDGRASGPGIPVEIIPGTPRIPEGLDFILEGLVPVLSWDVPDDPHIQGYNIYRSVWHDTLVFLHYSTVNFFIDNSVQTGVLYHYRVSAINDLGMESELSEIIDVFPMALDKDVVFYNLNVESQANSVSYYPAFLYRLFDKLADQADMVLVKRWFSNFDLPQLSHYRFAIFDMESRLGRLTSDELKFMRLYMANGGRVIYIMRNVPNGGNTLDQIVKYNFRPGDFFYDILKIDSSIKNMVELFTPAGDLMSCQPQAEGYPLLTADTMKVDSSWIYPTAGYIPFSGFIYPQPEADILYTYQSSVPDTINQGMINGIRYLGDDGPFVLFNFPPTLMDQEAAADALVRALYDLGLDVYCGDANGDMKVNVGDIVTLINYLYRGGSIADQPHADVNCDDMITMADAIVVINNIFKKGRLNCCESGPLIN